MRISASRARVGDKVILNGPIGDRGTIIMIARGELGLDPLYIANEGKLIAVGATEIADAVVAGLRKYPNGRDACVIGEVKARPRGMVVLETAFGGARIVDMLVGEQAPRIC